MINIFLAAAAILNSAGAFHFPHGGVRKSKSAATAGLRTPLASAVAPPSTSTDKPNVAVNDEPEDTSSDGSFDWFKSWYPIVPVEFLDADKPHKFKLMGVDIAVWNDGPIDTNPAFQPRKSRPKKAKKSEGQWRAFVDECPHRKVPLSEGRIEDDGSLLCSYHGWRFDGEGMAINVPQVEEGELARIKANPKSNCNSFPVRVVDGVLWVWPDASDDAKIESALSPVPSNDYEGEDIDEGRLWLGPWNFRELPYGHDYFIENVVDQAHVPVSHHNVVGSRYSDQSLRLTTVQPLTKSGFSISGRTALSVDTSQTTFRAPSQVLILSPFGTEGARQYLELYSSPSRPGFANHVGRMVIVKDSTRKMPKLLQQFTLPIPIWLNHVMASLFLNQDALFLHGQERALAHTGKYRTATPGANDSYASNVLATSADRGVMLFRTWMGKFANGHIPFRGDTTMPASDNEVVFDVWNSHTKNCKYCLAALGRIKALRKVTFLASALVATIRPKFLGIVGSTLAALGLSGLGLALSKLIGMFYRFEFSHAENH